MRGSKNKIREVFMLTELGEKGNKIYRQYIECDCHTHAIQVCTMDDEPIISISMWSMCDDQRIDPYGWWFRLKHIWRILTTGHPYEDQINVSGDEAELLVKSLQEMIEMKKSEPKK